MYFLYPETCGVRLEDMGALFGDATGALGTPAINTPSLRTETDALLRTGSPTPQVNLRGRPRFGAASALPGLNIDPPTEVDRKRSASRDRRGGLGGWLSGLPGRRGPDGSKRANGYEALDQTED